MGTRAVIAGEMLAVPAAGEIGALVLLTGATGYEIWTTGKDILAAIHSDSGATAEDAASAGSAQGASSDGNRDVKIDDKIQGQLGERGWTEDEIRDLANTTPTGTTTDNRRPNKTPDGKGRNDSATVYGPKNGGHIIVNDVTGEVTQVSDKTKPWIPDSRIKWR